MRPVGFIQNLFTAEFWMNTYTIRMFLLLKTEYVLVILKLNIQVCIHVHVEQPIRNVNETCTTNLLNIENK